jgi:hypothetical protein
MTFRVLASLVTAAGLALTASAQLPRIVVQGSGSPQVFTDFAAAVAAAQANDVVYLGGGTFTFPSDFALDKPLHFIGAGIHPDSSQVTSTTTLLATASNAPFVITTSASGSTFTGITFDIGNNSWGWTVPIVRYGTGNADDLPTDIVFQRCRFGSRGVHLAYNEDSAPSTVTTVFDECIFNYTLVGFSRGATVTRCIFDANGVGIYTINLFGNGGLYMENCVLLGSILGTIFNGTVRNCISTSTAYIGYNLVGTVLTNNVVAATILSATGSPVASGNITGADATTFFVSESDDLYQYTDDLHLQPGCVGVGLGTDGTDVGIYGTASPYKPGGVPFNPHFLQATIGTATNAAGELPVNIRVAAQSH